jgi:hypothetical protein
MLDMVVDRREMKDVIGRFIRFGGARAAARTMPAPAATAAAATPGEEPAR